MQLGVFSFLASAIAATLGASIESVLVDISNIKERVSNLYKELNAYPMTPCGSTARAASIHFRAEDTWTAIITTIKHVKTIPAPVSVRDGTRVLNSINGMKPLVIDVLKIIVAKKSAFQHLRSRAILTYVAEDLAELNYTIVALEDALISRAPTELLDEANALKAEINAAFATAIAAYNELLYINI